MKGLAAATLLGAASAARMNIHADQKTAPAGYTELPGKCTGHWIETWSDGHFAHYGEDRHIDGLDDCADTCDEHPECAGFYTKNGKCSHWRSGSVTARPQAGHTCYVKEGGGAPAPAPAPARGCDELDGYDVSDGKCAGHWIENWADGHFAHYGEDHHISDLTDCADTCDEHSECAGFYTKEGKCSHWRSGSVLPARSNAGHCCYSKSGSSLIETAEDDTEEDKTGDEASEEWHIHSGGPRVHSGGPRVRSGTIRSGGHRHRRHRMGRRHRRRMGRAVICSGAGCR